MEGKDWQSQKLLLVVMTEVCVTLLIFFRMVKTVLLVYIYRRV